VTHEGLEIPPGDEARGTVVDVVAPGQVEPMPKAPTQPLGALGHVHPKEVPALCHWIAHQDDVVGAHERRAKPGAYTDQLVTHQVAPEKDLARATLEWSELLWGGVYVHSLGADGSDVLGRQEGNLAILLDHEASKRRVPHLDQAHRGISDATDLPVPYAKRPTLERRKPNPVHHDSNSSVWHRLALS